MVNVSIYLNFLLEYIIDIKCEFKKEDMKLKKHIKAFAAICSLAMVFSIFTATVSASDISVYDVDQKYITDNDGYLPKDDGMYKLTEDIVVNKTTQIDTPDITVGINLNGHKITYTGSGSMYIVGKVNSTGIVAGNVDLIIGDGTGAGEITTGEGYTGGGSKDYWISNAFATDSTANSGRGGCILLSNSCTFDFNGGTISGFKANDEGGAVHVTNGSTFRMTGGTIKNCTAKSGGAISVHTSSKGETATINGQSYNLVGYASIRGGTITGNKAEVGGGIRAFRGSLLLENCVITDNTATSTDKALGGGGVQYEQTVDRPQDFYMAGTVKISGNHASDPNKSDLYFAGNIVRYVTLIGDLAAESKIVFGCQNWKTGRSFFELDQHSYDPSSIVCGLATKAPYYDSASDSIKVKDVIDPSFKYYGVSISGDIVLNTKIDLGTFANDDTSVTYEYTYTKKGTPTTVTKTLSFSDLQQDGDLYMFSVPVESACMTAPIKMTINYNNGSTVDNGNGVTIEEYAKDVINGNYGQDIKDVAEALIIYGGYAQVQLGINTDKLPTVDGVNFSQPYADNIEGAAYALDKDTNSAYYGSTVSFLSETCVKLYFKKAVLGDQAPAMTVSCSSAPIQATTSGSYYVYTIYGYSGHGFLACQYDVPFDFSIGDDISGTYSVGTYLKLVKYSSSASSAMKNLAEAYYNFALKCDALNVM